MHHNVSVNSENKLHSQNLLYRSFYDVSKSAKITAKKNQTVRPSYLLWHNNLTLGKDAFVLQSTASSQRKND
jgi:hypothetical protein